MKKDLNSFLRQAEGAVKAEEKVKVQNQEGIWPGQKRQAAADDIEAQLLARRDAAEWVREDAAVLDLQALSQLAAADGFVMDFAAVGGQEPALNAPAAFQAWDTAYVPVEEAWLDAPVEAGLVEAAEVGAQSSGGIGMAGLLGGLAAVAFTGVAADYSGKGKDAANSGQSSVEQSPDASSSTTENVPEHTAGNQGRAHDTGLNHTDANGSVAPLEEAGKTTGTANGAVDHTAKPDADAGHPAPDTEAAPDGRVPADTAIPGQFGDYLIYTSDQYGKYINVNDFGADPTGKQDSLAAIKAALAAAAQEQVMLYMDGKYYISDQIVLNQENAGAKGIFGSGMGETVIQFDKAQEGVFNPNTNHDDIRAYAGILVDGQNGKTIANLSVEYTNGDFYRKGSTYFGKVCGVLVNDADNTLISKVEASGANRAGVLFTSTAALTKEEGSTASYKARIQSGEINEDYANLPLGSNNRVVDSNLHNNRVAGLMISYQEDFTAQGNYLAWNGHQADGGTGYGATVMAGSYNYGVTMRGNTTDHNYRKGLDVHDGNDFVIENNTLNGDRLYGIAVYNRQFSMDNVVIRGNTITQDAGFRLQTDDDLGPYYQLYSAIQLQTNTQFRDLNSADTGYFEISNNTINNLTVYGNSVQQYGIEFRNHETDMKYTLNITGNNINGESTKYLIAVINDTRDQETGKQGIGSGTINISNNTADIGSIVNGAVPVYVEEKNADGAALHGSVTVDGNNITVRDSSGGYAEFTYMRGNAAEYNVTNNTLDLGGNLNDGVVEVRGIGSADSDLNVVGNTILTEIVGKLYQTWLRYSDTEVFSQANTHNGDVLDAVNTTGTALTLTEVLASVSKTVAAANEMAYTVLDGTATTVENNTVNVNIV